MAQSNCAHMINTLRRNLTDCTQGLSDQVASLESCMALPPAPAGTVSLELFESAAQEVAEHRGLASRLWPKCMETMTALELAEACEAMVADNYRAADMVAGAFAELGGVAYDPSGYERLKAKGTGDENARPVQAGAKTHAATDGGGAAAAASSAANPVDSMGLPDEAFNSPERQMPACRTPRRNVMKPMSPLDGMRTPTMEDFGISAAGLAAIGGEGVDAAMTASAAASVMRSAKSQSRTARRTSDVGTASDDAGAKDARAADTKFFSAGSSSGRAPTLGEQVDANEESQGTIYPLMEPVADTDLESLPTYLKSQFPSSDDVNGHIEAINDLATDKRFEDGDNKITQTELTELLGAKAKGLILLLIHVGKLQAKRDGKVTHYLIK